MSIFYFADPHFGHEAIRRICHRPFASVEEMDEALIRNWNERVTDRDTVYILGDFWYKGKTPAVEILRQLKGQKFLIRGNHDEWLDEEAVRYLIGQADLHHIVDPACGGHEIWLCHYPLVTWPGKRSLMVHGHVHDYYPLRYSSFLSNEACLLNAGVEINGYVPVQLEELVENNLENKSKLSYGALNPNRPKLRSPLSPRTFPSMSAENGKKREKAPCE